MTKLTLYGARGAPNPRRVQVFLAEHGLAEGKEYAYIDINMAKGEHKRGGRYETPNRKVPMLMVDDVAIGESLAICRYIEETRPESSAVRLYGRGALQRAKVEMWTRRIELELLFTSVGKAWLHGEVLAPLRKMSGMVAHASELTLGLRSAQRFYNEVERELAARGPFVAGDAFTVADITLLCVLDFAVGLVRVPMPWSALPHLLAWHIRVSGRASVRLHPDPYALQGGEHYTDRNVDSMGSKL